MTKRNALIGVLFAILFIGLTSSIAWNIHEDRLYSAQNIVLQEQVSNLQSALNSLSSTTKATAISEQESSNRKTVASKSQDQLLTSAVARTTPAVVSIVISQNAPQYTVTCENPFGDDPNFQGLNFCVPTYKQTGTSLEKVGAGTGLIFTHDGYIVTNKHVIFDPNAQYTVLLSNGKQQNASVVYRDSNAQIDIAIIKITGNFPTIASLGDSGTLKLGQTVATIGNALGEYNNSVSVGIISGLHRSIEAADESGNIETLPDVIQTDASINPGNSGGPLIDLVGNVVGINVAGVQGGSSIGFSIPINSIKGILSKYK